MPILAWIVVGIIAGFLAKRVFPGHVPGGLSADLIMGVVGAMIGGWIMNSYGSAGATGFNPWSLLVAFLGASLLLWLRRTGTRHGAVN